VTEERDNGKRQPDVEKLHGEWAQALWLESTPEERRAIVAAGSSILSGHRKGAWRRVRAWLGAGAPSQAPRRLQVVSDLVAVAAVAASALLVVQLARGIKSVSFTSRQPNSSPAVYFQTDRSRADGAGEEVHFADPVHVPRPF
jgi:hypothetical protein